MQSEIPKQFLLIAGKPILMHTLEKFHAYSGELKIILVLPETFINLWKSLVDQFNFIIDHQVIKGGDFRFESVKNGLEVVPSGGLVAIHDGVRPLVSIETLERVFDTAQMLGNAIPIVPVTESLRQIDEAGNLPVDRNKFRLVQTPQCFHSEIIKKAYAKGYNLEYTDDAMVAEAMGIKINLVDGNSENIKITHPSDILFADSLLALSN